MSKTVTLNLSDVEVARINAILSHRRADNFDTLLHALISQGATQLEYHYERNKTNWKKTKEQKAALVEKANEVEQLKAQLRALQAEKAMEVEEDEDDVVARD